MTREEQAPSAEGGGQAGQFEEVDVAIFGAGPAGLSTALALIKAFPDLKVLCLCLYKSHTVDLKASE